MPPLYASVDLVVAVPLDLRSPTPPSVSRPPPESAIEPRLPLDGIAGGSLTGLGLAVTVVLVALALIRPRSIDEGQYVAAAALAAHHLPYRDFGYLQTPLYPELFSLLAKLFSGWLFVAARIANALCGAGSFALLGLALRRVGVAPKPAMVAAMLFLSCDASLFSFGVARNDALPTLFLTAALASLAKPGSAKSAFVAAFCLGVAAVTKLTFAIPAATVAALALVGPARLKSHLPARWVAAGLILPIVFVAIFAWLSPGAFLFENFIYPVRAPVEWYHLLGRDWKTGWGHPIGFLGYLARGPALPALFVVGFAVWRMRKSLADCKPVTLLFIALTAAGFVAAYLPNPARLPYLMPLLPPLFVSLGLVFQEWPRILRQGRFLWLAFAAAGLVTSAGAVESAIVKRDVVAISLERQAHRLGGLFDQAGIHGPIAGLSPETFADSGGTIDPRFAAGPFLFRMVSVTRPVEDRAWRFVTLSSLRQLDEAPPAAIVVDLTQTRKYGADLSLPLLRWARHAGFVPAARVGSLWVWLPRPVARRLAGSAGAERG